MNSVPVIPINYCTGANDKPQLLNPEFEPLTTEKLRPFKGYENLGDEQAAEILESIRQFAFVLYGAIKNIPLNNTNIIDNQLVVHLNKDSEIQSPVIPIHKKLKNKVA